MQHLWTRPERKQPPTPLRAAVIDDDDEFRRGALRALRRLDLSGVGLLETTSALRWLETAPVSLVVVDQAGVASVARVVRTLPAGRRPLIVAASSSPGADAQALRDGACALVEKPIDADHFLRTVARVLGLATRRSVLLVDDDDDIRESFSLLLEDNGYDVIPAPHGKAAWSAIERGLRPDVILLDLMMPFMNGEEVLQRLKSSPSHHDTPVVVITAGSAASLGEAPVLQKPIDMNDLLSAVARAARPRLVHT